MPIFQCYFFLGGRIDYLENLECDTVATLRYMLENLLADGEWEAVQAWKNDRLICEVGEPSICEPRKVQQKSELQVRFFLDSLQRNQLPRPGRE
jgi:hypothetical protein